MLESAKILRRQSEIRQALAELVGKEKPTEDETRKMAELDAEYRANETRYRAALIAEDTERREAGRDLETRQDRERAGLIAQFELRQVALALDEGRALSGPTLEIVTELRGHGGYRGIPIPLGALQLEQRVGETIAAGVIDPIATRPIIDRLFPQACVGRMGGALIDIESGAIEYPVVTSAVTAAWADGELASVAAPVAFATTDKPLKPEQNFGVRMQISRKAMLQSGPALEAAIRRDMNSAIAAGLDAAAFLGTGATGQPLGVITGAGTYGITSTALNAAPTAAAFRTQVVGFMVANAAPSPADARLLIRPETFDELDQGIFDTGSGKTQWDKLLTMIPAANIAMSSNALPTPAGGPPVETSALLTTNIGGVPPFFLAVWGGVDLIRDPFSDAASGQLRLTGILTADVTVGRPAQLRVLTDIQHP
ncbi:MAG: phage major capsid protein [Vitreimonas sp.]